MNDIKIRPDWLETLWNVNPGLAQRAETYLESIGADIRNKLSPQKNLLAILNECQIEAKHDSTLKLVEMEKVNVEKSIEYLKNLL